MSLTYQLERTLAKFSQGAGERLMRIVSAAQYNGHRFTLQEQKLLRKIMKRMT